MSALTPDGLFQFLRPYTTAVFGKSEITSLLDESRETLAEFISDPKRTFLMARKSESVVFQTFFCYTHGPVLLCQKREMVLPQNGFQGLISVMPVVDEAVLPLLQTMVGQFFGPYLQNTLSMDTVVAKELFEALRRFEMTANKLRRIVPLPEPILEVKEEIMVGNVSPEEEWKLLTEVDLWKGKVETVISTANEPPEFQSIKDEIEFWAKVNCFLVTAKENVTRMSESAITEGISKHKPWLSGFLSETREQLTKLCENVGVFASDIGQFDPDDGFDKCSSVSELNEKIKKVFNWWNPFCETCRIEKRIPVVYSLLADFFLRNLGSIIYRSGILTIDSDPAEISESVEALMTMWNANDNIMMGLLKRSERSVLSVASRTEFMERFHRFLEVKDECSKMVEHIKDHEDVRNAEMIRGIEGAFALVRNSPILDVDVDSVVQWTTTINEYGRIMSDIDEQIAEKLRTMLADCETLVDISNVFRRHGILYRRERVSRALVQYQQRFIALMLNQVEKFLAELHNYSESDLMYVVQIRGAPSETATMIHFHVVKRKLKKFEVMLRDVVGGGWGNIPECERLKSAIDECNKQIAKKDASVEYMKRSVQENDALSRFLFLIEEQRGGRGKTIKCNFSPSNLSAICNAKSLPSFRAGGMKDVMGIIARLEQGQIFYLSLNEGLAEFLSGMMELDSADATETGGLLELTADRVESVYSLISQGWNLNWESDHYGLVSYSKDLLQLVSMFQSDKDRAIAQVDKVNKLISCMMSIEEEYVSGVIEDTVTAINSMVAKKLSNVDSYVTNVNSRIRDILTKRVWDSCRVWTDILKSIDDQRAELVVMKVSITSNRIMVQPPFESIHSMINHEIVKKMNGFLNVKLVSRMGSLGSSRMFRDIVQVPHDMIWEIYEHTDALCQKVAEYVSEWTTSEGLFRAEPEDLRRVMEVDDVGKWVDFLLMIEAHREIIDAHPERRTISVVTVDTRGVQSAIKQRISRWKEFLVSTLETSLPARLTSIHNEIDKARYDIERDVPTKANELAAYMKRFSAVSSERETWEGLLPCIETASKFVSKVGYEQLAAKVQAFGQIYQKRSREIEENRDGLVGLVERQCVNLSNTINEVTSKWGNEKPVGADILPEDALSSIAEFQAQFKKLGDEMDEIKVAQAALKIEANVNVGLAELEKDCCLLSEGWTQLGRIWAKIQDYRQLRFSSVSATDLMNIITRLTEKLQQVPTYMHEYAVWSSYSDKLKAIVRCFPIIEGLKMPAVQPRHWQQISQQFGVKAAPEEVTTGQLLDLDMEANEQFFGEVLRNAQGEFSIRQYFEQLDSVWDGLEFEVSDYKGKMSLIKGWDLMLSTITDHLNFLSTMQTSPFFNVFREKAKSWETQLNRLQVLLNDWLDVQRRFMYLEGVFSSGDIGSILPNATGIFRRNENDIRKLTDKALQLKHVMKVLTIPNVESILQMLSDNLSHLQKWVL